MQTLTAPVVMPGRLNEIEATLPAGDDWGVWDWRMRLACWMMRIVGRVLRVRLRVVVE